MDSAAYARTAHMAWLQFLMYTNPATDEPPSILAEPRADERRKTGTRTRCTGSDQHILNHTANGSRRGPYAICTQTLPVVRSWIIGQADLSVARMLFPYHDVIVGMRYRLHVCVQNKTRDERSTTTYKTRPRERSISVCR